MRRILCLAVFSFLALVMFVPVAQAQPQNQDMMGQSSPKEWSVAIEDFYFEPANIAVNPGDTVTWTNEGAHPHTVTSDDGQFDSETLMPGESFSVTFEGAGTLPYHCEIHPSMTGSVAVGGGGGGAQPAAQQPAMQQHPMMGGGY